jgi:hypothetical protein
MSRLQLSIVAGGVALQPPSSRRRACDLTVQGWGRLDPAGRPAASDGRWAARGTIDRGRGALLTGRPAGRRRARTPPRACCGHAHACCMPIRASGYHTHMHADMPSWFSFVVLLLLV